MDPELLTVVAVFRARPGHEMALGAALRAMLLPTRNEDGCLNYDLHQGNDDPGLFFFHETRESADHHQAHLDTPHVPSPARDQSGHAPRIDPRAQKQAHQGVKQPDRSADAVSRRRGRGDQAAFATRHQRPVGTLRSR